MTRLRLHRGDTIVEVMVAFAVMAVVILSISTLMGMGLNIAQRSLETSLVRQQIDAQADLLRYAQDERGALWSTLTAAPQLTATPMTVGDVQASGCSTAPNNSFILYFDTTTGGVAQLDTTNASNYREPVTYSFVSDTGIASGMWIQVAQAEGTAAAAAYDFYIRSCWYSTGSSEPITIATIVRLYDY